MRGPRLAQKAGFFYPCVKGEFAPTYRRPVITERLRSALPAQVDLLTAVFGGPLFCPLAIVKQSDVSRNFPPAPFAAPIPRKIHNAQAAPLNGPAP